MGKVYRVTVRHPTLHAREAVKYGGKQVVVQTWAYYRLAYSAAQRRADFDRRDAIPGVMGKWDQVLEAAVFKVEVAPDAAFQDISASYQIEEAKPSS